MKPHKKSINPPPEIPPDQEACRRLVLHIAKLYGIGVSSVKLKAVGKRGENFLFKWTTPSRSIQQYMVTPEGVITRVDINKP